MAKVVGIKDKIGNGKPKPKPERDADFWKRMEEMAEDAIEELITHVKT